MLMQDTNLYPVGLPPPTDNRFGTLGYPVGSRFDDRAQLAASGLHRPRVAGIWGTIELGGFSVVISGGYEDDRDEGNYIEYTGAGGQADSWGGSNVQVADQSMTHHDNLSLQKSVDTQRPVRVIRGPRASSKYAPGTGYRFDGMYVVEKAELTKGKNGYSVCKFYLRRVQGQIPLITNY